MEGPKLLLVMSVYLTKAAKASFICKMLIVCHVSYLNFCESEYCNFHLMQKLLKPGISPRLKDHPLKQSLLSDRSSPPSHQVVTWPRDIDDNT